MLVGHVIYVGLVMATASLVPVSETDASGNITSGSFTDIDNTIVGASGTPIVCNNNNWTNQSDNTQDGEILFGLTNAPGDFDRFISIRVQIRAQVDLGGGFGGGDTATWRMEIEGTNAPTATLEWIETEEPNNYVNKEFTDSGITPSAADIDGWVVHIYQWLYNQDMGPDGYEWKIDEIELILDYNISADTTLTADPAPLTFTGGAASLDVDQAADSATLNFTGGAANPTIGLPAVGALLSLAGGTALLDVTLESTGAPLNFTGGTANFNIGTSIVADGAPLALAGGTVTLDVTQVAVGTLLTLTGGTADLIETSVEAFPYHAIKARRSAMRTLIIM